MKILARDIMNPDVFCVSKDMDLRDLAKVFLAKGITGAPVLDEREELVGVISQTDLLYDQLSRGEELMVGDSDFYQRVRVEGRHLAAGFQVEDSNVARVGDVMTPVVHCVLETTDIHSVSQMMLRKHIHRVIVRRGKKVAGIISALDILKIWGKTARPPARRRSRSPVGRKGATPRRKRSGKRA